MRLTYASYSLPDPSHAARQDSRISLITTTWKYNNNEGCILAPVGPLARNLRMAKETRFVTVPTGCSWHSSSSTFNVFAVTILRSFEAVTICKARTGEFPLEYVTAAAVFVIERS